MNLIGLGPSARDYPLFSRIFQVSTVGTVALTMYSRLNLVVGLQPRIVFAARHTLSCSPVISRRLISNSTRSHAEHASRPTSLTSGINERTSHAPSPPREYDAHGSELNPYRNGPSALDKAVHLFFFTEIIRGMS